MDRIQGPAPGKAAQWLLPVQKRMIRLGTGWEGGRTAAAPMQTVLGYCTTLLLEALHLFLNGYSWPTTVSDKFYMNKNRMTAYSGRSDVASTSPGRA